MCQRMQHTLQTQPCSESTEICCVKTWKRESKEYKDRTAETLPSSRSPMSATASPPPLFDGSCSALWGLWGMDGENMTMFAVFVGHGEEQRWEVWVWKCLTQGCPCSWGGLASSWGDARSCCDRILLLLVTVFVPGETLLIEGYDDLRALIIGLFGEDKIGLIRVFPARDEEPKPVFKMCSERCISAQVR